MFVLSIAGIQQFVKEGIPTSKLVLGVPWYGYNYPCKKITVEILILKTLLTLWLKNSVKFREKETKHRGYHSVS